MTTSFQAVSESQSRQTPARVTSHEVTFQMRVVALHGEPVTDGSALYDALSKADEALFTALPRSVEGWRFLDSDRIECDRLEIFQPDFGHDEQAAGNPVLYDITVGSSCELALHRAQATPSQPLSVEQLFEQVPELLKSIYAAEGVVLELHRVQFNKKVEYFTQGDYVFG